MIDIRAFRHEPRPFLDGAKRKGAFQQALDLLNADEEWRAHVASVDDLRAQQKIDGKPTPEQLDRLQEIKRKLKSAESELADAAARRAELLEQVPNPPQESGPAEDDAIRHWRKPPQLRHPKDHVDLGRSDTERQ